MLEYKPKYTLMIERPMQFNCGDCGEQWLSSDYQTGKLSELPSADSYAEGYYCPSCQGRNVSGVDL